MFDGDNGVDRDGSILFDEPREAASDEVLERLIGTGPTVAAHHAISQGRADRNEASGVFGYQDSVSNTLLHMKMPGRLEALRRPLYLGRRRRRRDG